jgi:hypothetical protein
MTATDTTIGHPPDSGEDGHAGIDRANRQRIDDLILDADDSSVRSSLFARHGLGSLDVLLILVIVLITCAYTPFFYTWSWAPRAIMLCVTLPAGLVATVSLARGMDRSARWGLGLVAWATVSAALSGGFFAAFKGFIGQDTTVLFWVATLGLYSMGRLMSHAGREMLQRVVVAVLAIHAVVGSLQMVLQIDGGNLGLLYGRSIGLTPNPVYFGGFMATGVVMCLHRVATTSRRMRLWGGGSALFGVALSFSGSRVALGSVVIVGAVLIARHRNRSVGLASVGVAAGVLVGTVITRVVGAGNDATSRLSETNSGGRITHWMLSWDAFLDRPVFGWGLGRFRTAIQGDLSFEFVASIENNQVQWDAHNLIVGTTVALGLPGLILLGGFAWSAARHATGVLAFATLALSLTWLLQPAGLMTLPFAMVLLGAAGPRASADHILSTCALTTRRARSAAWGAAIVVGVAVGGWLAVAELRLSNAMLDGDPYAVSAAASMYGRDPIVSNLAATSFLAREPLHPEHGPSATQALKRSTEFESTRPLWWTELANRQGVLGDFDGALVSARRALDLQPTNETAWMLVRQVGLDTDDEALVTEAETALCRLGTDGVC